ncbi:39S ribosomal protein L33 [Tropilaelaps mercedesae]|uniref:39S ribosomal protein L33 n=1 Tax=Tropilaelaps mercedesae TaxID=418985 RepID=A0A1V9XBT9_9ACAR|nr:39S ribosomal protein L33 [Tropilaelaps mercedesae]
MATLQLSGARVDVQQIKQDATLTHLSRIGSGQNNQRQNALLGAHFANRTYGSEFSGVAYGLAPNVKELSTGKVFASPHGKARENDTTGRKPGPRVLVDIKRRLDAREASENDVVNSEVGTAFPAFLLGSVGERVPRISDHMSVARILRLADYTEQLDMAKSKAKFVLVWIKSLVSGHRYVVCKPRLDEKLTEWRWDPFIQQMSVYKEEKKIKSLR